jgi:DNA-binding CsgD family transcriptional regulator
LLWCARAELAVARVDPDGALDVLDRLVASAPHGRERPIPRLAKLRGEALIAAGRQAEGETTLLAARDAAAALGALPLVWRIDLALAGLYRAQARHDEAASAVAAGRAIVAALAASVPDAGLREEFATRAGALFPPGPARARRPPGAAAADELTRRERDVAALLTRGKSNREIADELFISEWTVATHVRNILAKLDFTSRTQIAAWAIERGLGQRR